jgi:hypothetical protein
MKLRFRYLLIFGLVAVPLSIALMSQAVIDATVPIRNRLRIPTAGHAGSIGRKLPLQIAVDFQRSSSDAEGNMNATFILTNSSEKELIIPVWLHPGDLEPRDENISYAIKHLDLYITSSRDSGSVIRGGAQLYGSDVHPETLLTLLPGKSVRVLIRVDLPVGRPSQRENPTLLVGHAVLNEETVRTSKGQTFGETQEIGSAISPAYKVESLFNSTR